MQGLFQVMPTDFNAALDRIARGEAIDEDENLVRAWLDRAEFRAEGGKAIPGPAVAQGSDTCARLGGESRTHGRDRG